MRFQCGRSGARISLLVNGHEGGGIYSGGIARMGGDGRGEGFVYGISEWVLGVCLVGWVMQGTSSAAGGEGGHEDP